MSWDDLDLPEGWRIVTTGEIAEVVGGGTPKTSVDGNFTEEGGHPWLTPADLTGYSEKYISRGRRNLTDQGLKASSARYMHAGSVLFSSRAPIGYVAIATNPVTTSQGFRSLVPGDEVEPEYLYYALKLLRSEAEQLASGTTFPEISGTNVKKLRFPLAPRETQHKVVDLLDHTVSSTTSATGHLAAARLAIERFRRSVLASACSGRLTADWREANPDTNSVSDALNEIRSGKKARKQKEQAVSLPLPDLPDSYVLSSVGDCAVMVEYGTSQKCVADPTVGVPVLRMGNIQDGKLDFSDLKYCSVDDEIEGLMLDPGDLLFNRTNSPELVGKSAVYRAEVPVSFASYLIRVRFDSRAALPEFINYWLNSAWGRAWAQLAKTDGVSQSNINGSKLALMPVPLPPIDEQAVIVERASRMLLSADAIQSRVESASSAVDRSSQAVLAKAFRGQLSAAGL